MVSPGVSLGLLQRLFAGGQVITVLAVKPIDDGGALWIGIIIIWMAKG